jgi:predicted TPR repeat methyltransferase
MNSAKQFGNNMSSQALLKKAQSLHQQGNYTHALEIYQEILTQDPDHAAATHLIAILYAQLQQYKKAIEYADKAILIEPDNAVFHNTAGNIYAAQKNIETSISCYQKAITLDSNYAIAYNNLANQFYRQDNYDAAKKAYQDAISIDKNYVDAYYNLALLLIKQNEIDNAITKLNHALTLKPNHTQAHYQVGQQYLNQNNYQQAIEHLDHCLQQNPNNAEFNHLMGLALYQDGQHEGAIHYLEQTLIHDPKHPEANHNLANAHLKLKNPEIALNYFFKQLEITPFFESYYNIGVLLTYQERQRDAAQYLLQASEMKPDDLDTQLNLGNLYLKLLNYEKAIHHYQKAQTLSPNDAEINHILQAISQSDNPDQPPNEYTEHLFNQYAPYYDKHLSQFLHYTVPEQLHQAIEQEEGEQQSLTIIDLGCGTGLCGEFFARSADTLIGIDIAADMIEVAKTKNLYTQLEVNDIHTALSQHHNADLILAADVFTYIGDLGAIFDAVYHSLKPKGLFAFSVERGHQQDYVLQKTIRYAHSQQYIKKLSDQNKFTQLRCDNIILRKQSGKPVEGYLVILQK